MLPHGSCHRCTGPLVTMQRNPACSYWALLLRPEQRLEGNRLSEVNVEASRFKSSNVSERSPLMYDARMTGLIMIPLAALLSPLLRKPGELGILPHVNRRLDRTCTQQGESSQSEPIVLHCRAWPGRAAVDPRVGSCLH